MVMARAACSYSKTLQATSIPMPFDTHITGYIAALGIGLLIGLDRERQKPTPDSKTSGGLRTFAIAALTGAVAFDLGGAVLLAAVMIGLAVLVTASYLPHAREEPGLTTEIALVLTTLLGGLAMKSPIAAAGIAVVTTVLLATRSRLHAFVRNALSEREIHDGLVLLTAALVVLPLVPDEPIALLFGLNPRNVWKVAVLVMAIGAAGHVAIRVFGATLALPLVGFLSGFVSSTATIGAMGQRAAAHPEVLRSSVAAAALSTVATFIQLALVVGALSLPALQATWPAIAAGGVTALIYGAAFTWHALTASEEAAPVAGRAFDPRTAIVFAAVVALVQVLAAALKRAFGAAGLLFGAAAAGLVDAHAAAAAVAALVGQGEITPAAAFVPILAGVTTNTISKIIMAISSGGRDYAVRVVPGLVLVVAAAWAGMAFAP